MDYDDDPQKRVAELERQLAGAKAAAAGNHGDIAQLGHAVGYPGPYGQRGVQRRRPRRKPIAGTVVGATPG
jgi:hypothetical protein